MKLNNKNRYQLTTIKVQNLTYMYELNSEEIIGLKKQNMYVYKNENGKVETKMVVEYIPIEEVDKDNNKKNNK